MHGGVLDDYAQLDIESGDFIYYEDSLNLTQGEDYRYTAAFKNISSVSANCPIYADGYLKLDSAGFVSVSKGDYAQHIKLVWTDSKDATGYQILRDSTTGSNGTDTALYDTLTQTISSGGNQDTVYLDEIRYGAFKKVYYKVRAMGIDHDAVISAVDTGFYRYAGIEDFKFESLDSLTVDSIKLSWSYPALVADEVDSTLIFRYDSVHQIDSLRQGSSFDVTDQMTVLQKGEDNLVADATSGLLIGNLYFYRAQTVVLDDVLTTASDVTVGYLRVPKVENVVATKGEHDTIQISWSNISSVAGGQVSKYQIYRYIDGVEDGLKEVSGDKSSYVDSVGDWIFDTKTFPARTYTYRVMAAVDISEKILSEDVFETTIYSDLSEPDSGYTFPYGATLDSASQGLYGDKVVLTYSTPAYVDSAILYCSKLLVNVRVCSLPLGQPRGSVYQDVRETLIPGKKYEYRIKVYKNDLDTVTDYKSGYRKLAPPENFRVVYAPDRYVDGFADTARILLSWDSVNNVKGYNLYIKRGEGVTKDNFDDSLQFDTSATLHYEFVPDEFKENTDSIFDYSFAISSFMANGSESDLSDVDNGAVRSFSVENLRASNSLFDKKIRLSWSAPRYGKDEIESYEIFRKKDENDFERLTLATIKDLYDDTTFEDSDNLLQGSVYYYKIKTNYTDAKATSIFSDTSTCGSLPLEDVNLRVSKNKDSLVVELDSVNGADAYLLWKNEGSSQFDSEVFDTLHAGDYSGETISYKDEAVEAGHFYFYQLKAIRIVGSDTIFSNAETDYGYQKLVLDSVYAKVDSGGVRLSWSRSVNLGSLVPVEYHLYRKPVNGDWSLTNISSVLDSTIEPDDTIYTYLESGRNNWWQLPNHFAPRCKRGSRPNLVAANSPFPKRRCR